MTTWQVLKTATAEDGSTVELRYAEFGKGRAKVKKWEIYRAGAQVSYAVNERDAEANFRWACCTN